MRVFMFQDLWAPKVADGTKPHTIRRNARCKPGDLLSLRRWTGKPYRSKQQLLRTAVCTAVSPIAVTEHGVCVAGLPVPADQIAVADGFRDWPHMLEWFSATHGLPFTGDLIEWDPKLVEVCPQCGESTVQANLGNGKIDVYCEECGWPDEDFGTPDCRCFNCATASHNGGDDDCACDEAGPWFNADRCLPCKHRTTCDVALHPELYPDTEAGAE